MHASSTLIPSQLVETKRGGPAAMPTGGWAGFGFDASS
jgi:hypothetical protein